MCDRRSDQAGRCARDWNPHRAVTAVPGLTTKRNMIQTIRTLITKHAMRTAAGRMIFFTGLLGFALATVDGVFHAYPALAKAVEASLPALQQQRLLMTAAVLLFAAAYWVGRSEGERRRGFLDQLLEFWEFRPLRDRQLSCRLYESAHLALIAVMFHRALFL